MNPKISYIENSPWFMGETTNEEEGECPFYRVSGQRSPAPKKTYQAQLCFISPDGTGVPATITRIKGGQWNFDWRLEYKP